MSKVQMITRKMDEIAKLMEDEQCRLLANPVNSEFDEFLASWVDLSSVLGNAISNGLADKHICDKD